MPILWRKKVRLPEESAQHHTESGWLECEARWPEPKARLGRGAPSPPPGPVVGRLGPLMPQGQLGSGQRVCLVVCSAVSSHIGRTRWWGSSIHHLLPTQRGSSCLALPYSACPGHWPQRQPPPPEGCQGKKRTQLGLPPWAPQPRGWKDRTGHRLHGALWGAYWEP